MMNTLRRIVVMAGTAMTGLVITACAQASVLSLSSTSGAADTPTTLSLSLDSPSGEEPSAVQWTFTFPQSLATVQSAVAGPAAESAGKTLTCALKRPGSYSCVLYSLSTNAIPNGVVAELTLTASATAVFNVTGTLGVSPDASPTAISGSAGTVSVSVPSTGSFVPIRVNAGGPDYIGVYGNLWRADYGYSGGNTYVTDAQISQALNPTLFQTERYDSSKVEYRFAVPAGRYAVTLYFSEIFFDQPGHRIFNAAINGSTVLSNYDIVSDAGGPLIAVKKSFEVDATDSILIQLTPVVQNPKISAIEIVQAP